MKFLVTTFTVISTFFLSFAQPQVKFGPIVGLYPETPNSIFAHDQTGYYLMNSGYKMGMTSNYSYTSFKHIDNNGVIDKDGDEAKLINGKFVAFNVAFSNEIYLFTTELEKGKSKLELYHFNKNTLQADGNGDVVAEITAKDPAQNIKGMDWLYTAYSYCLSPDSTKLLITNTTIVNDKPVYQEHVYDSNMKLIWEKTISPDFAKVGIRCLQQAVLDNNGNVFSLEYEYKSEYQNLSTALPVTPFAVHLTIVSDNGANVSSRKIEDGGKQIVDCTLHLTKTGELELVGFYSTAGAFDLNGTFFETMNKKTGATIKQTMRDLPQSYIETIKMSTEKNVVFQMPVQGIVENADGGITIIGAAIFLKKMKADPQEIGKVMGRYEGAPTGDIALIKLNKDGEIEWQTRIARSSADSFPFGSFSFHEKDGKIFIIYNDNPKNLNLPEGTLPKLEEDETSAMVVLCIVDEKGVIKKSQFFTPPKKNYTMNISITTYLGNNMITLLQQQTDKYCTASTTLN